MRFNLTTPNRITACGCLLALKTIKCRKREPALGAPISDTLSKWKLLKNGIPTDDGLEVLCRPYNDFFAYDYDDGEEETDDNYYLQPIIYEPDVLDVAKEAVEELMAGSQRWRNYIEMRQRVIQEYENGRNDYRVDEYIEF